MGRKRRLSPKAVEARAARRRRADRAWLLKTKHGAEVGLPARRAGDVAGLAGLLMAVRHGPQGPRLGPALPISWVRGPSVLTLLLWHDTHPAAPRHPSGVLGRAIRRARSRPWFLRACSPAVTSAYQEMRAILLTAAPPSDDPRAGRVPDGEASTDT